MKGMFKAVSAQAAPAEAEELVGAVVADLIKKSEGKEKLEQIPMQDNQNPRPQMLEMLNQSLSALDQVGAPGEKAGFCTCSWMWHRLPRKRGGKVVSWGSARYA